MLVIKIIYIYTSKQIILIYNNIDIGKTLRNQGSATKNTAI